MSNEARRKGVAELCGYATKVPLNSLAHIIDIKGCLPSYSVQIT